MNIKRKYLKTNLLMLCYIYRCRQGLVSMEKKIKARSAGPAKKACLDVTRDLQKAVKLKRQLCNMRRKHPWLPKA